MQNRPRTATNKTTAGRKVSRPQTSRRGGAETQREPSEREWLGQELHDGPAQLLVVALMQVRAVSDRMARGDDASVELDNLRALICASLDDVRALSRDLGGRNAPGALRPALEELAKRSSNKLLAVEVLGAPPGLNELSPAAAGELLRIAQTALGNVIRHASASRCTLVLSENRGRICLQIDDDGRGFDPMSCGDGMGLSGMRDRAAAIGGGCSLETSPGNGTSVRVEVPIRQATQSLVQRRAPTASSLAQSFELRSRHG